MRYYMVDPDNEERLLKIPPMVRDKIRADALHEAWKAISEMITIDSEAASSDYLFGAKDALAVIDRIKGD